MFSSAAKEGFDNSRFPIKTVQQHGAASSVASR